VGRTLRKGDVTGPLITVAGVVENVRSGAADRELPPVIYRPHDQWASGAMSLVVRTGEGPTALAPAVRGAIRKPDSDLPIASMRTMREIVSSAVAQRRFQMMFTALFAGVALLLGAVRGDVVRWVPVSGMRPVLIGLVAGLGGAVSVATALRSLLFEVTPTDPISIAGVALVLLLASGLACYLPARRAARLDLRHE
jgi:putative ABC transport system permease protein